MAHNLEMISVATATGSAREEAAFAFTGSRQNVWHRLGAQFGDDSRLMTVSEVLNLSHLDRQIIVQPTAIPEGVEDVTSNPMFDVVLDGKMGVTPNGELFDIPRKLVGRVGHHSAAARTDLQVEQAALILEQMMHVSNGEAVWSTGGSLHRGTRWFLVMVAPSVIIDPNGVSDIIRKYVLFEGSHDGSIAMQITGVDIRGVCENTIKAGKASGQRILKVRMTKNVEDRLHYAAEAWSIAQDEGKALRLLGEQMLAKANGRLLLKQLTADPAFKGTPLDLAVSADTPKRSKSIRERKLGELMKLYYAPTNEPFVGDNAWAAYNTVTEYLDWFSDVKGDDADDARAANVADHVHDALKAQVADYLVSA